MVSVGASEVAVMLGVQRHMDDGEPYVSELELQQRLLGTIERYDDDPDNVDAQIGRWAESMVASKFIADHGLQPGFNVLPGPQLDQPGIPHPTLPWLAARPDLKRYPRSISVVPHKAEPVELKAPRDLDPERWGPGPSADDLPPEYLVQLAVQVACMDAPGGTLAAMARAPRGNRWWVEYRYERDLELEGRILHAAGAWYQRHVVDRDPVVPDGSASAASVLGRMFRPADETLYATREVAALVRHIEQRRNTLREVEQGLARKMQELQAAMGTATVLKSGARILATWRWGKSGRRYFRLKGE